MPAATTPKLTLPPVLAIHGVGTHLPDQIQQGLGAALQRASATADVTEFNWDWFVSQSPERTGSGVTLLEQAAESLSNAAALPLLAGTGRGEHWLLRVSDGLYHSVFRVLVAAALALLLIGPILQLLVLLPSTVFTSMPANAFGWVWRATVVAMSGVAAVFALLLVLDLIRAAITWRVAPVLVTLRRGALLCLQPVILLLTVPLSAPFGSGVLSYLGAMVPLAVVSIVLNLILSPLFGVTGQLTLSIGQTLLYGAVAAVLAGLHMLLRGFWVGGPLKIVLDIARYMGAPTYRKTLQEEFDTRIQSLGSGERQVLIVAHSLGSVIAIDSLINSAVWTGTDTVRLVTLGSPIRRSFMRFFPGYLFPPSVEDTARLASGRLREFSWINIHRRWDYVGTSLGADGVSGGLSADLSTGQAGRVISAHSNYWEDDVVIGALIRALRDSAPVPKPAGPAPPELAYTTPFATPDTAGRRVGRAALIAGVLAVALVAGLGVANFTRARSAWLAGIDADLARLRQTGTTTLADVTYRQTIEGGGEDAYRVHHFVFRLPELALVLPEIRIVDTGSYEAHAYRFDHEALASFIGERCRPAEKKSWWQIFRRAASIPCTRTSIPIVYDASRPESFMLPMFPVRTGAASRIGEIVGTLFSAAFFTAVCAAVVIGGGVPLFRLFLGLKARPF